MTFKMWINTQDFTIIMPDQVTCFFSYGAYGAYDVNLKNCEGEVDTLNDSLWFYWYTVWGPYSFGDEIVYLFFK